MVRRARFECAPRVYELPGVSRITTELGPQPSAFGQAWQPPHHLCSRFGDAFSNHLKMSEKPITRTSILEKKCRPRSVRLYQYIETSGN
jgi:hypothetical protein